MPVRQMKLRFTAKPTTRVVPSLLVPRPQTGKSGGNKDASGETLAAPVPGVTHRVPGSAAKTPPAPGSG